MPETAEHQLLDALLDSWDRNNTILVNLLRLLPEDALVVRALRGSPSIAQHFAHIHYVRLVFVQEDAPDFARELPVNEWAAEPDAARLVQQLTESAQAVRRAVKAKVEGRQEMNLHYDHPILLLQHMIWHEGYHHGQIKLTLKLIARSLPDGQVGPATWGVWMRKS